MDSQKNRIKNVYFICINREKKNNEKQKDEINY